MWRDRRDHFLRQHIGVKGIHNETRGFKIKIRSNSVQAARQNTRKIEVKIKRDTLSETAEALRTVVTFVTWNRVSSLESVL